MVSPCNFCRLRHGAWTRVIVVRDGLCWDMVKLLVDLLRTHLLWYTCTCCLYRWVCFEIWFM
jgi:hypothetical protein